MSWIRHRRPNFSPIFPHFSSIFYLAPSSNPAQAPAHVFYTWHPCASSHATLQDPAINHGTDAPSSRLHHVPTF